MILKKATDKALATITREAGDEPAIRELVERLISRTEFPKGISLRPGNMGATSGTKK